MGQDQEIGRIEAIWIKRAHRADMEPVQRATAVAGLGLEDNLEQGGRRQVTLLSADAWRQVEAELGTRVDPRARRANILVSGIDLEASEGKVLDLGGCRIEVCGETLPCRRMDQAQPGLCLALKHRWRCGCYGVVMDSGAIAVGDPVRWQA